MKELERKIEIQREKIKRLEELMLIYDSEYMDLLDIDENSPELGQLAKTSNTLEEQRDKEVAVLRKYKQLKLDA